MQGEMRRPCQGVIAEGHSTSLANRDGWLEVLRSAIYKVLSLTIGLHQGDRPRLTLIVPPVGSPGPTTTGCLFFMYVSRGLRGVLYCSTALTSCE